MADRTVTVKSSSGDYPSLNAALSGESPDLVTNTRILTIECYAFEDSTAAATGTGYTTSSSYYINITVPTAERHSGIYSTSKYRLTRAGVEPGLLSIRAGWTRVDGLQLKVTSISGANQKGIVIENIGIANAEVRITNCILVGVPTAASYWCSAIALLWPGYDGVKLYVVNCLIYDFQDSASGTAGIQIYDSTSRSTSAVYIYNTTIQNCGIGISEEQQYIPVAAKNCGLSGCTTNFAGTITQTTCSTTTPTFVDGSADNFHLASNDSTWKDQGTNLYNDANYPFQTDIDGQDRGGSGATWDIGADEYQSDASIIPLLLRQYRARRL